MSEFIREWWWRWVLCGVVGFNAGIMLAYAWRWLS